MTSEGPKEVIDTLHLTEAQWKALADLIDESGPYQMGRRRYERVSYRKLFQLAVAIQQPNGQWVAYAVRSRNICAGGIGFIHGMYVHTGTACRIILKTSDGEAVCVEGIVKCCTLLTGNAHHVGVQFNQEIDVDRFLDEVEKTNTQRHAG